MNEPATTEHVLRNRAFWDGHAEHMVAPGRRAWSGEPTWGLWGIPDSELGLLDDVAGLDAIELGCGTAYVSAWLARAGARPVGIDNSRVQLASASVFQREFALPFPLVHGTAETTPFPDGSFDFAISEYGASIWCDPYRWIPEAARLLRPGGRLVFLKNHAFLMLFAEDEDDVPAGTTLKRDYFGMHRFAWPDGSSVEFHLTHGEMLRLLRSTGFTVEALHELQAGPRAASSWKFVTGDWARRWPSEEVWVARKVA
ncbi:MAG: class I SAM-dependent methyltransferase [Dehalococcoidia bacterium]